MARFQTFVDADQRAEIAGRVARLRRIMADMGLAGFVVPRSDEHQSEYVPPSAERLAWLTGFTGSAGLAVVLHDRAGLFLDGRYTVQGPAQTDTTVVTPVSSDRVRLEDWIAENLPSGGKLGYDPMLHTPDQVKRLTRGAARAGGQAIPVTANPVDAIWNDRPAPPRGAIRAHPQAYAGEPAATKLERIRAALQKDNVDALLVSDPHNLCWTFNIRGSDIGHTPLVLGYALIRREGKAVLFLDGEKVGDAERALLQDHAEIADPAGLARRVARLAEAGTKLRLDKATVSAALVDAVERAGGTADLGSDPIALMKAVKNDVEQEGARRAHLRDGVAVTRFLAWLDRTATSGTLTEIEAAEALESFRTETGLLKDVSFPSIAGAGPNAALPHYRVSVATNRTLAEGIFLIDSGAQYEDGTTDITRTVAIGSVTGEMRDRNTRVLRGHIAIAMAVFPKGTSGAQIDALARLPLWQAGLDFDHGTGHGIGSYLSVHEGPQRISKLGTTALEAGMMLSNEPGYYKEGAYGIRIENLILVEPRVIPGAERDMLGFETLTLAPIDRRLIDIALMRPEEIAWLDAYHARVNEALAPHLDRQTKAWLEEATRPLAHTS